MLIKDTCYKDNISYVSYNDTMQDILCILFMYIYICRFQVQHQQKKYKSITSSFSGHLTYVKK